MKTKDKILFSALDLFSQKGYDGVGVDQIAESVGLKGPSIYRHFKGKEDILNQLVDMGTAHYNKSIHKLNEAQEMPDSVLQLKAISLKQIEFTISDPMITKFRKIISMEQFKNPYFAELATHHYVTIIEEIYTNIFEKMIKNGTLKENDPNQLAVEYTYPISILIHMCDRQPEKAKQIMKKINNHIDHFIKIYGNI